MEKLEKKPLVEALSKVIDEGDKNLYALDLDKQGGIVMMRDGAKMDTYGWCSLNTSILCFLALAKNAELHPAFAVTAAWLAMNDEQFSIRLELLKKDNYSALQEYLSELFSEEKSKL